MSNMAEARWGNVSTREYLRICDMPLGTWLGRAVFMTLHTIYTLV